PGWHPDAAGHEAGGRVEVKVESRAAALAHGPDLPSGIAVIEPGPGVRLVWRLVRRKADVPVDPEHGPFGVADDLRGDGHEPGVERLDETAHRIPQLLLVHVSMALEPLLPVVPRQIPQECERGRPKSVEPGHRRGAAPWPWPLGDHGFQNPCDGMRNARLKREDAFSHAMTIVSCAMVPSS